METGTVINGTIIAAVGLRKIRISLRHSSVSNDILDTLLLCLLMLVNNKGINSGLQEKFGKIKIKSSNILNIKTSTTSTTQLQ